MKNLIIIIEFIFLFSCSNSPKYQFIVELEYCTGKANKTISYISTTDPDMFISDGTPYFKKQIGVWNYDYPYVCDFKVLNKTKIK